MLKKKLLVSMSSMLKGGWAVTGLLLLLVLALALVACAGPGSASTPSKTPEQTPIQKPSGSIAAKWIEPQVDGDIISIPVSEIESNWNTRFKLQTADGYISAMAYVLNGVIYVRANVCPPCRSQGFSLVGDILVCDTCRTEFKASTGEGISGACVNYPKASVKHEIIDGKVVMTKADIELAYQNTLNPGQP